MSVKGNGKKIKMWQGSAAVINGRERYTEIERTRDYAEYVDEKRKPRNT